MKTCSSDFTTMIYSIVECHITSYASKMVNSQVLDMAVLYLANQRLRLAQDNVLQYGKQTLSLKKTHPSK